MQNLDLHYFFHGLLILFIGLLGGFPFASAIKKQNGRETAWRVVHSGSSVGGVTLIAIGAFVPRLEASTFTHWAIFSGIAFSTYSFVIGMVLAAISGQRGIGVGLAHQNKPWKTVYYLYAIGAVISIPSFGSLLFVCAIQLFL